MLAVPTLLRRDASAYVQPGVQVSRGAQLTGELGGIDYRRHADSMGKLHAAVLLMHTPHCQRLAGDGSHQPAGGVLLLRPLFRLPKSKIERNRILTRDKSFSLDLFQARVGPDHTLSRNGPLLESEHGLWHLK